MESFLVTGDIDLIGDNIQFGDGASKEHYTLCHCGASSNKPFCDGMHKVLKMIRTDRVPYPAVWNFSYAITNHAFRISISIEPSI